MSGRPPGPERAVGLAARLPRGVGLPERPLPPSGLGARRTADGLAVTALGSGTCPAYPVDVELQRGAGVRGRDRVRVVLDDAHPGQPCTRDLVPTTHVVALPEGAPAAGHLEVLVVLGPVEEVAVVH